MHRMTMPAFAAAAVVVLGALMQAWPSPTRPPLVSAARAEAPRPSLDLARALIEAEQFEAALAILRQIDTPDRAAAARVDLLVGRIYLAIGKPAKALDFFEKATFGSLDGEADGYLGLAEAKLALGAIAQARRHAESALKSDPDLVAAHLVLARADQRIGKGADALKRLRKLERERPESEEVAVVLAKYQTQFESPGEGIQTLEAFVRRVPTAPHVLDALGQMLWAAGRKAEAVRARIGAGELYLTRGQDGRAAAIALWLKTVDPDGRLETPVAPAPTPQQQPVPPPVVATPAPLPAPLPEVRVDPQPLEPQTQPQTQPQPQRLPPPAHKGVMATVLAQPEPLPFAPGSAIMTGSGVVIEGGRTIVTNRHVIEGMTTVAVRNGTGHVRKARILRISSEDDLALLEIDQPFPEGSATAIGELSDPSPGRPAIVMGFPMIGVFGDEQPALTEGVVAKTLGLSNDPNTFQMTTKINKGNSGGPIFDRRGRLIGVSVSKVDVAGIFEKKGILVEDINIGIKAGRILRFLGRSASTQPAGAEIDLEDLYQEMLPRVVLIAAQK